MLITKRYLKVTETDRESSGIQKGKSTNSKVKQWLEKGTTTS